jgi:predicted alpha-1,2-mannosidase
MNLRGIAALVGAVAALAAVPQAARAADFSTSFEPSDPPLTWTNSSEESTGVSGTKPGLPGSLHVMDKIVNVTANGNNPPNEIVNNLKDGDVNTKWLTFTSTGWAQYQLSEPVVVRRYQLASANDAPGRDPRDWQLQGSDDGTNWTTLDTQTNQDFAGRFTSKTYDFTNDTAYSYYRLNITRNHGDSIIQLSELVLSDGSATVPPPTPMNSDVGTGPVSVYTAKSGMGFTGLHALRFGGSMTADGHDHAYNRVLDVSIPVTSGTQLAYKIFPEFTGADPARQSTYSAVDLKFSDSTYLRDLGAIDQHGFPLTAAGQGASKSLYAQQWNAISADIGAVAAGKTITEILVDYDNPNGISGQAFQSWIDDLAITADPASPDRSHLSDWVDTRRGTNANGSFSRGNNIPATAVPHGFNFWVPETAAGSTDWLYRYQEANDANNLPTLQAFAASHEPSPWMGDRQTFQVMPAPGATPAVSRGARALEFSHDDETARPYYYGVTFKNGMKTEVAPADHAAMFRFTFTGDSSSLIFDNVNNRDAATTLTPSDGNGQTVVTGYSDVASGLSNGAKRMFIYATFDEPSTGGGVPSSTSGAGGSNVTRYLTFDTSADKTVTMRIATSFISVAQAQHNLELELTGKSFDDVRGDAQSAWDKALGVISVEGATPDQMTTLYSNLYRLNLYPNETFENTGSNAAPVYMHADQATNVLAPGAGATPTQGTPPLPGRTYANNGFWDTYRTVWAADSLLYPGKTGEMVDGFVQQYRDGGWIARWSSPGYADLMDGASSDVAFSTAYQMGAAISDPETTLAAALKNSSVVSPDRHMGRKGLDRAAFLGYTPAETSEGFSWAVDGYINDYGVANMAKALYDKTGKQEYYDDYRYFLNRAQQYVTEFDPAIGMFQSRRADGTFTVPAANWDPRIWGTGDTNNANRTTEFTETDPWNMQFTVPQDGNGLANLLGGRAALAGRLDQFFSTPELATGLGSYGVIHEMTEASAVRIGQWGLSNQPSHHIPYMYDFTGQPWKGQAIIREALSREFIGSEIGQGYPGDEDNGELSSWQILSALGLYPLQMGSANWAVGSPLFTKATIHLENGNDLVINAANNNADNVYVQSLRINGKPYHSTSIPTSLLRDGATLDFDMGPAPSDWGSGAADAPPSLTEGGKAPSPLMDATAKVGALFDDTSGTRQTFASQAETIEEPLATTSPRRAMIYTITSGDVAGDPRDWTLQGSDDGTHWRDLDTRAGVTFAWRLYTKPFVIAHPGDYRHYRLNVTANSGEPTTTIAELELLSPAPGSPDQAQEVASPVSGSVPATLALTLGAPASFGAFTPGVDKTYDASTTADVLSTAGDAALSVSGPTHLTNGPFSLPDPLQVEMSPATWSAPVSHDPVAIAFHQHIGSSDPLRTGSYSATVTFTLSTTNP